MHPQIHSCFVEWGQKPKDMPHHAYGPRLLLTQRLLAFRCVPCVRIKGTDIVSPVKGDLQLPWWWLFLSWWSEGITIVGRIKSRDVQSNGKIFLSHRVLHIFRTTAKSYRGQSLFASVLKFMYRAVKSTKICSVPRIFKTKCKLFMCAKGKHKTKRNNSPCWPQNLAEQSSGNNLLNSRI